MTTEICKSNASPELVAFVRPRIVIAMSQSRSSVSLSSPLRREAPRRTRAGYTLIELMIVVAVTGVLAAVAIPAFRGYILRSRAGEAGAFLGIVKLRQAAYRSEFGQYAGFDANIANIAFAPGNDTVMRGNERQFPPAPPVLGPIQPATPFWAIGASPDGEVRFGYGVVAGSPAQALAGGGGTDITSAPYNQPANSIDFYFIAQATANLDDDGTPMVVEITSFTRDVWSSAGSRGYD